MSFFKAPAKGQYFGTIHNILMETSNNGKPCFRVEMKITEGADNNTREWLETEWDKRWMPIVFYFRTLTNTRADKRMQKEAVEFLKSLDSGVTDIHYDNLEQFSALVQEVSAALASQKIEYKFFYEYGAS